MSEIKNCINCAIWKPKNDGKFPPKGICGYIKSSTYGGNGCWRFAPKPFVPHCSNCGYDKCKEVTRYDEKAQGCRNYIKRKDDDSDEQ